jgi:hypothetical protein
MTSNADAMGAKGRGTTPPYIPYQTFKTFLQDLEEHGIPGRVDNTALKRFSGGVARQLKTALRFLHLIDGDDHPTDDLSALSGAFGGDGWPAALAELLRVRYSPVMSQIELAQATPGQLREAFKDGFGASGNEDVLRKSELFFLQAAQEAELPISKRVSVVTRRRSGASNGRRRGARKAADPRSRERLDVRRPNGTEAPEQSFRNQLLEKFPTFDPAWPDELKTKWFDGFKTLMGMAPTTGDGEPSE